MNSRWHIGAKELRGAIAAYAKRFDLLEVRIAIDPAQTGGGDKTSPSLATLRRWRKHTPPHFVFSVVAGPHVARVKPSHEADVELEAAIKAVDVLEARCFVLRTAPEVTPSPLWRERLAKTIGRVPHDVTHFVWEPSGVWEVEDAAAQARAWEVLLGVDPARDPVPAGPLAYLRLRALGATRSFGSAQLARVVNAVGPRREVFAVLETDSALAEAKRLRALLREVASAGRVAAARLVRPGGTIVVRDDEQE